MYCMIGTGPLIYQAYVKGIPHCHNSQTLHFEKFDIVKTGN